MTVLVGIQCESGVVLASDSSATFGAGAQALTIGQQMTDKIFSLGDRTVFASSGSIGMSQILRHALEQAIGRNEFSGSKVTSKVALGNAMGLLMAQAVRPHFENARAAQGVVSTPDLLLPLVCKTLIAACHGREPTLFQFSELGVPELASRSLPFVTLGSGQPHADPFLAFLRRTLWPDRRPSVEEGRLAATWTIYHVCATAFGFVGGPVQLATLTHDGKDPRIEIVDWMKNQEHVQHVEDIEDLLADYVAGKLVRAGESAHAPPVPAPSPTLSGGVGTGQDKPAKP